MLLLTVSVGGGMEDEKPEARRTLRVEAGQRENTASLLISCCFVIPPSLFPMILGLENLIPEPLTFPKCYS